MLAIRTVGKVVIVGMLMWSSATWADGKKKSPSHAKEHKPSPFDSALDFIAKHSAELKLKPEQSNKLELLQEMYAKLDDDPAVRGAIQEMKHAHKKGSNDEAVAANKRLCDAMKLKSNGVLGGLEADLGKIFTAEQMKLFAELRPKSGIVGDAAPDAAKMLVNPFEP